MSTIILPMSTSLKKCVTFHLGCGGGGVGQLNFSEMRSYPQWEYCVEVSQRQHSLHQCVPKEILCTDFLFISGKR